MTEDEWGMTAEDYEIEQDAHLRKLNAGTKKAERETEVAIRNLTDCLRQRRVLVAMNIFASTAIMVLSITIAIIVYVFHG